jgi:hypothetical protein
MAFRDSPLLLWHGLLLQLALLEGLGRLPILKSCEHGDDLTVAMNAA